MVGNLKQPPKRQSCVGV